MILKLTVIKNNAMHVKQVSIYKHLFFVINCDFSPIIYAAQIEWSWFRINRNMHKNENNICVFSFIVSSSHSYVNIHENVPHKEKNMTHKSEVSEKKTDSKRHQQVIREGPTPHAARRPYLVVPYLVVVMLSRQDEARKG